MSKAVARATKQRPVTDAAMQQVMQDAMDDAATPPDEDRIAAIARLAQEHKVITDRMEKGSELLKKLAKDKELLEAVKIPAAMKDAGLKEYVTATGLEVATKEIVAGSLTEPKRVEGLKYLRELNAGGLIKSQLSLAFAKGQEKLQQKALAALAKIGLPVEAKETVHAQTLCAWVREYISDPKNRLTFNAEKLGVYVGERATVKQRATT